MSRSYVSYILDIDPGDKPRIHAQAYDSAQFASPGYISDLVLSAAIATLGLVLNSTAVLIGAMLLSPMMKPILACGLAFAASDVYLGVKSFVSLFLSVIGSVLLSALLVWQLPFQSETPQVVARTQPNLLDLGVAVFSGLAGAVVMVRSPKKEGADAIPGVAIAVALLPPLCVVGFGIGSGWDWEIISGAGLLFLTSLFAIAVSAFLVFYFAGMDTPAVRASITEETMRRATGTRLYAFLQNINVAGKRIGEIGQPHWRILMIAVTLVVLYVPLRSSIRQLHDETVSRAAARKTVRALVPAHQILSQQLELSTDGLTQRLITTAHVDKTQIAEAELDLARRTGKKATIVVRQVPDQEKRAILRERLRAPTFHLPPPPPSPSDLTSLGASVEQLTSDPILAVWPASAATLAGHEIGFTDGEIVVRLSYYARNSLEAAAAEIMRNALQRAWGVENLKVILDRRGAEKPKVAGDGR